MKNSNPKRKTRLRDFIKSLNRKRQANKQKEPLPRHLGSRKLARRVARSRMEREGLHKINHRIKGGESLFARDWRKYV